MPDTGTGYRLGLLVSDVNVGIAAVGRWIMEKIVCSGILNCCSGIVMGFIIVHLSVGGKSVIIFVLA
jgi:hypothetical protein